MSELLNLIPVGSTTPLAVPRNFSRLHDLAYNMWWSWDRAATDLFATIDRTRWRGNENPVALLGEGDPSIYESLSDDASFTESYADVTQRFDQYLNGGPTWFQSQHGDWEGGHPIAYMCTEYGIHHKLRLYSGGLGVLAGDHLKAASDLGVPIVAVGLMYRKGYFQQTVDHEGNQQHIFYDIEPARRAVRRVLDPITKLPLTITVDFPDRSVHVAAWRLDVGRIPLLLLDTDLPQNDPADRPITHILYVRGREMRLHQEVILGVGGVKLLDALAITPSVWHVNEGHAAPSVLERAAAARRAGADAESSITATADRTVFTLHTPVPAGNEVFPLHIAQRAFGAAVPEFDAAELEHLGAPKHGTGEWFDLGALAIRLSDRTNGVSQRHADVVTHDWSEIIGGPAAGITNGVHAATWVGPAVGRIFRKLFGDEWAQHVAEPATWDLVLDVPDEQLWKAHLSQKDHMLRRLRSRIRDAHARHGASPDRLKLVETELPADRLTLVFARRMATYKRAGLLFSDPARVRALLTNPDRPVQVVFAGKAHPADREGQGLIRLIVEMSRVPELSGHIAFVENYDMSLGAALAQGADVWLNNPRPPNEASGTSGMKAAMNGGLNCSVLDGWWIEGYNGANGWGYGGDHRPDVEDAGDLYHILDSQVVPLYYERDERGVPVEWVTMMKEAIRSILPAFSAQRMVKEYVERAYIPVASKSEIAR